ncbi:MAG TPA: WHG domain-containing protein [Actinocrinis sp.]|nr:WHG domain-containing protein [Actinocrinis sp.]
MPRAGLSPDAVVDAALEILDARGSDGLTLKAIADATGVAAPSLYKHVRGLPELRRLLAIRIINETAEQMGAVVMGRAGNDALKAYLTEYRRLASQYPHRHALAERASYDDPTFTAAAERLVNVAYAVVRGFGLEGEDLVHAVRSVRAAVTGFVSLEQGLGYRAATDTDASFAYLSRVLAAGLRPSPTPSAAQ